MRLNSYLFALAEVYTMHSFALLQNHIFQKFARTLPKFAKFWKETEQNSALLSENFGIPKAVQRSALCRSRRELSNTYFFAKVLFDTAENKPCEVCRIPLCTDRRAVLSRVRDFCWLLASQTPSRAWSRGSGAHPARPAKRYPLSFFL